MAAAVPVLAVVVATRGGTRLEAALSSVAWSSERAVLDPVGDVTAAQLAPDVRLGRDVRAATTLGSASWLLLLGEHEVATESLAGATAAAVGGGPMAWRVPVEIETLGVRFALRSHPIRLAPRERSVVALDRTLELELQSPSTPQRRLNGVLRSTGGKSVAAAVDMLVPESRALAALLAQLDRRPRAAALAADPLAALLRVLRARTAGSGGLARWVTAVFAGYRVTLAHAMLWEWRHAQPAPVRVVA